MLPGPHTLHLTILIIYSGMPGAIPG